MVGSSTTNVAQPKKRKNVRVWLGWGHTYKMSPGLYYSVGTNFDTLFVIVCSFISLSPREPWNIKKRHFLLRFLFVFKSQMVSKYQFPGSSWRRPSKRLICLDYLPTMVRLVFFFLLLTGSFSSFVWSVE